MFDNVPGDGTGYVLAAYLFFLLMILIYIGILGVKFQRINRDIGQLTDEIEDGTFRAPNGRPTDEAEPSGGAREETSV